jgi:X-X-X-Leu-X-X-Gly heptad repeat protein
MDTISRDNNSSYLPVAGVIVGLLALVLSAVALVKVSSANKTLAAHEEKIAKVDAIESTANSASAAADKAAKNVDSLAQQTQSAVTQLAGGIATANEKIAKLEEGAKKPMVGKGGSKEPVVAGPDEYIIKGGDSFAKIARAHGCSIADITAVNPGVDSSKLKVGQRIKLPAKK